MAGATLPPDGQWTTDTRTEAQMKADFDAVLSVIRRTVGAASPESLEIAAGVVTPTGASAVLDIETEGSVGADALDTIAVTNLIDGSVLIVFNSSGNTVTLTHEAGGSGQMSLQGDVNCDLDAGVVVEFYLDGTIWREKGRAWGDDSAPLFAYLGLGNAATATQGSGNGLDADTVDGLEAAAFLGVGAQAADSAELGGVAAANFARKDVGSEQLFAGVIRSTGSRVQADQPSAGFSSGFNWLIQNTLRATSFFDDVGDEWKLIIYESDGSTPVCQLKIDADDGVLKYDPDASGTFYDIRHTGVELTQVRTAYLSANQDLAANVTTPINDLTGIAFPLDPDSSRAFEIAVDLYVNPNGGGGGTWSYNLHVGPNGDETDPQVFTSANFAPENLAQQIEIPPTRVVPDAGDLVTVTVRSNASSSPRRVFGHGLSFGPVVGATVSTLYGRSCMKIALIA